MDGLDFFDVYHVPRLCKECGGVMIYKGVGEYRCEDCDSLDYDDYGKVRLFIEKHRGATAMEIESYTGVSQRIIRKLLRDGRIEVAAEHVVGVAQGVREDIIMDLRANFEGECSEVGMYLAMARVAHREGYPEIGLYWEKAAWEEAEHAAKFAELLGDVVWDTKTNLDKRMNAESGACADKYRIAKRAKELNLDAIHDTVHEMAKDEARHGKGFEGLYNRYFGK